MFANIRPTARTKFTLPPCHLCKHYTKGSCKKFFAQEPVGGEIVYFDAHLARDDYRLCGGKYFKRNWDWDWE
jgi:hypothetical protein